MNSTTLYQTKNQIEKFLYTLSVSLFEIHGVKFTISFCIFLHCSTGITGSGMKCGMWGFSSMRNIISYLVLTRLLDGATCNTTLLNSL